jgi:hypothetical protein
LIVLNVPITPDSVTGPFTGGQYWAHDPLHLDFVEVSGANQYSVKPLALVSTVAPPIFAVFTTLDALVAAAPLLDGGDELGVPPEPAGLFLTELPQAARVSAAAARVVVTHHGLRIGLSPFAQVEV